MKTLFRNFYLCSECGEEWDDTWTCACNDKCSHCGAETEPYLWEEQEITEEEYDRFIKHCP